MRGRMSARARTQSCPLLGEGVGGGDILTPTAAAKFHAVFAFSSYKCVIFKRKEISL